MTDETLLEKASRGDEAAFRLLYERHRDAMFRFAYRLLGSVELAEDVTQDCFLSLIKHPGGFDPARASLRTYLYAATRNLAMKHFRQRGQQITVEELAEEPQEPQASGPLGKLLDEELATVVRKAIAELVPLQREALVLFEYEGLTLAEIAEIVRADVGTVKARLSRARAGLRRSLAPYLQSSPHGVDAEKVLK
jgi:RNA polymerase sigma-70 factor (ECF subfamily)